MSDTPQREPRDSKPESAREQRETVLDNERKANEQQPRNFKDDALTDKVIEVDPEDGDIQDLDAPQR